MSENKSLILCWCSLLVWEAFRKQQQWYGLSTTSCQPITQKRNPANELLIIYDFVGRKHRKDLVIQESQHHRVVSVTVFWYRKDVKMWRQQRWLEGWFSNNSPAGTRCCPLVHCLGQTTKFQKTNAFFSPPLHYQSAHIHQLLLKIQLYTSWQNCSWKQ